MEREEINVLRDYNMPGIVYKEQLWLGFMDRALGGSDI